MAEFIPFMSRAERTASHNMGDFIRFCREDLTVFGAGLRFDDEAWDVSASYPCPSGPGQETLHFTEFAPRRSQRRGPAFGEPLGSQARAYIRYEAGRRRAATPPQYDVFAFRAIAAALKQLAVEPDLLHVDRHVLDAALNVAIVRGGARYATQVGQRLGVIAAFLRKHNLSAVAPLDWQHGIAYGATHTSRIGPEADERRAAKLPSQEVLHAVADAFRIATEPGDVILTSIVALLCCAPDRINEILRLSVDCEIPPLTKDDPGYMLRWPGSKGFQDGAKAIPDLMAPIARQAIMRLRQHTNEARLIATWYEENPGKLYLPEDCAHLRGMDLTASDVARIIGFELRTGGTQFLRKAGVVPIEPSAKKRFNLRHEYLFADVERAIVGLLPPGWPILDPRTELKFSEALMVSRQNQFGDGWATWRCMIAPIAYMDVYSGLSHKDDRKSMFDRLGLSTPERPIRLTSHQLRHYLNTVAQRGGLSQLEIAAWSGRRDVRQNAAYDQRRPEEVIERKRQHDRELAAMRGGKPVRVNPPVTMAEVAARGEHGHATEIGFCTQDFAAAPCPLYGDCMHCTKHVCIKGSHPGQVGKVAAQLALARGSLAKAAEADLKDYEGAAEWVRSHTETIQRLEQLHALLTDPATPVGSKITLAKSGRYTLIEQAMRDHQAATGVQLIPPSGAPVPPSGTGAVPLG